MIYQRIELAKAVGNEVVLVNKAFRLWRETHVPIATAGASELKVESFHRCHVLHVIHKDGEVLSMCLSTFVSLEIEGVAALSYFGPMSQTLRDRLERETPRVMTVEWITVHPKERERIGKIRQPDLILGCAVKTFAESNADMSMGYSRVDVGADRIAANFGYVPEEPTEMLKIVCNVMVLTKARLRPHKFAVIQRAVDELFAPEVPGQAAA